jgi:hypothetical protein
MQTLMVRSKVKSAHVSDVEVAVDKVFAAIAETQPDGVRYATTKLPDGVTFVALLHLDDGVDNPLLAIPAFIEFQNDLKQWIDGPPDAEALTVVGNYRLF